MDDAILRFYKSLIKPGDLCFDVGANVGELSYPFLRLGAKVVAVEPQRECIELLQRRCDRFMRCEKLFVEEAALGAAEGQLELMIADHGYVSSATPEYIANAQHSDDPWLRDRRWTERRKVRCKTLDGLIRQYGEPAYCKIDVEGYEAEVIKGLSTSIPFISFEYTVEVQSAAAQSIDLLCRLGNYEFNYSVGLQYEFQFPAWVPAEKMLSVVTSLDSRNRWGDVYARVV